MHNLLKRGPFALENTLNQGRNFGIPEQRERKDRFSHVLFSCEDVLHDHGREALEELIAQLQRSLQEGKKPARENLEEIAERYPERKTFAQQVIRRLVHLHLLDCDAVSDTYTVSEKLLTTTKQRLIDGCSWEKNPLTKDRLTMLLVALEDVQVMQKQKDGLLKKVPVFYQPKTVDDAFSRETIRSAEFQFSPNEISDWFYKKNRETLFPTAHERVPLFSSVVACALFHPRFGNGERSEQGELVVTYQNGERRPITGAWFKEFPGMGMHVVLDGQEKQLEGSPLDVLRIYAPELFAKDLLRVSDFEQRNRKEVKDFAKESFQSSDKGILAFEGLRYSLGKEFANQTLRLQKISPEYAILLRISENEEVPVGIMQLFTRESTGIRKNLAGRSFTYEVPRDVVRIFPYEENGYTFLQDARGVDFGMGHALARAKTMMALEKNIRKEGNISLRDLPRVDYERVIFSDVVEKNHIVVELAMREVGRSALEILSLLAQDAVALPEVMRSLTLLPESHRARIAELVCDEVREYRQNQDALTEALQLERISFEEMRDMQFVLRNRLFSSLTTLRPLKEEFGDVQGDGIVKLLEEQKRAYQNFGVLFKEACKGRDGLQLRDFEGIDVERRNLQERKVTAEEQQEMLALFNENWKQQDPVARSSARKSFLYALESTSSSQWMMLKKNGKLLSFLRADRLPEEQGFYLGSLNVEPDLRGSALGEQVLSFSVHEFGKEHDLFAHFVPSLLAGTSYVERQGFVITGVDTLQDGDRSTRVFAMRREKDSQRTGKEYEKITERTFTLPQDEADMIAAVDELTKRGCVATRFFIPGGDVTKRTVVFSRARS